MYIKLYELPIQMLLSIILSTTLSQHLSISKAFHYYFISIGFYYMKFFFKFSSIKMYNFIDKRY